MSKNLQPGQFYGSLVAKTSQSGIVLSELRHPGARRLPDHSHEAAFFCLLLEGAYVEQVGHRTLDYRPFTVGFHPAGIVHRDEIGPCGGRFFCVEVAQAWVERASEYAPGLKSAAHMGGEEMVWLATRLYREYREAALGVRLATEGLVLEMLAEAIRAPRVEEKGRPRWLAAAVDIVQENFSRSLTVEEVAGEVGVHPVHLARVFRRTYRQTLGEYLNRVRVRYASAQLQREEVRLSDLALAAGFADQSHFTRVFRRITGKTPSAFRASLPQP